MIKTVEEYILRLPKDRREAIIKLRETILKNIPKGYEETISYGMIGYVVPHALYPEGYACTPELPLPFVNIANQKNHIAVYHMGMYSKPELLEWFKSQFPKHSKYKLDMGKSCIRFKKPEHITFDLIAELMQKMSTEEWISIYEKNFKK